MNKHILTIAITGLSLLGFGQLALAHEDDEENPRTIYRNNDRRDYEPRYERADRFERGGRLQYEMDHLKRMLIHVDQEMRTYRADRHVWREYRQMRANAERLKDQLRRGEQYYNRGRVLAEIENLHSQLHHIEQELHVRANEWYQWR